uniref:Copia protein n=1 Tax=Cajanus cajan TaxID=3821 RepID=A0A151U4T5_CAJCA|nr:Copia protein [Cajanus cajan]
MAAASCATQSVWLRRMLEVMHQKQDTLTVIFCDNKSAIALCRNPVFHGRSKHIDIWFHKIRELVAEKEVAIEYFPTEEQVVDIFTKPLKAELFYKLKKMLGMIQA